VSHGKYADRTDRWTPYHTVALCFPLDVAGISQTAKINLGKVKLYGCVVLNEHNIVFASKRSAIRTQNVCFLHWTMPIVACLRLSDVSVICRVIYFQLPIRSACLPYIIR